MNEVEQRLIFIEVLADKWSYKTLNDQGLELDKGWRVVSVTMAGAGQDTRRSYALAVLVERPVSKAIPAYESPLNPTKGDGTE